MVYLLILNFFIVIDNVGEAQKSLEKMKEMSTTIDSYYKKKHIGTLNCSHSSILAYSPQLNNVEQHHSIVPIVEYQDL